jgi:hypothetical protein
VGEIEVLRCLQPALGFEEAAIHAVAQWRYHPAPTTGSPFLSISPSWWSSRFCSRVACTKRASRPDKAGKIDLPLPGGIGG